MDDIKKLAHLIEHWLEHNSEHARTYLDWAGRADAAGKAELAGILRQIAGETEDLQGLFKRAREAVS